MNYSNYVSPWESKDGSISPMPIKACELAVKEIPPLKWAVEDLLPEGLAIFAGAPKVGKSWLVFDLCLNVAKGTPILNRYSTDQGDVLYAALEDGERRIKERMLELLEGTNAPDKLEIIFQMPGLDSGGLEIIESWLKSHADARLVVIDTLGRVRKAKGVQSYNYQAEADLGDSLQSLAKKYNVSIMIVHHTRKQSDDDPVAMISGTFGLVGVADVVWVLARQRGKDIATLFTTGRDIGESTMRLEKGNGGSWFYAGQDEKVASTPERQRVLDVIRTSTSTMSPKEIKECLGFKNHERNVDQLLKKLLKEELIEKVAQGKYLAVKTISDETPSSTCEVFQMTDVPNLWAEVPNPSEADNLEEESSVDDFWMTGLDGEAA